MHGTDWHDHEAPKPLPPEGMAGADAIPEVEGSGVSMGMGKLQGGPRNSGGRKRMTPVSKGRSGASGTAKRKTGEGRRGSGKT